MADVKWIKIATNMFDNRKIRLIESMPEGDALIVIWYKLLCLAGTVNDGGIVYFTKEMPYTDEMLASVFNRPLTTIRLALETFKKFEMIEILDSFIQISNWEKYQNVDELEKIREQTRKRVAIYREKQKSLVLTNEGKCNVTSNANVTQGNALDKEEDKELEVVLKENITKEKDEPLEPKTPVLMPKDTQIALEVHDIFNYWNVCDIIVHKTINEKMVSQIEKSLKIHGLDDIKKAIKNYMIVLKDSRYYFKTKWTLIEFLKQSNALPDFFDAGTKWINYLEFVKTKGQKDRPKDKYEIENQNKDPMEGMEVL